MLCVVRVPFQTLDTFVPFRKFNRHNNVSVTFLFLWGLKPLYSSKLLAVDGIQPAIVSNMERGVIDAIELGIVDGIELKVVDNIELGIWNLDMSKKYILTH